MTRVLKEVLQHSPDLVVLYSGHNEFLEERTYRSLRDSSRLRQSMESLLGKTRIDSFAKSIVAKDDQIPTDASQLLPDEVKTRLDSGVGPDTFQRKDQREPEVYEQFAFNLHRMIELTEDAGCNVLLVGPGSNLKDCSPFKSEIDTALSPTDSSRVLDLIGDAKNSLQAKNFTDGETSSRAVLAIDPRCSIAHYFLGQSLVSLQRPEEALKAFTEARDHDVCTLRATSEIQRRVQQIADEKDVPFVDFHELASKHCKD